MSQLYYRIKEWGSQISVLQVTSSKKKKIDGQVILANVIHIIFPFGDL